MQRSFLYLLAVTGGLASTSVHARDSDWAGFHIGVNVTGNHQSMNTSGNAEVEQVSGIFWPGRGVIIVPGTVVSFPSDQFHQASRTDRGKDRVTFGVQAGYDWQFGRFVAGIEGDIQATNRSRTTVYTTTLPFTAITPPSTVTLQRTARIKTEWSARARVGAALGATMLYVSGGVAGARVKASNTDTFFDPGGLGAGCGNADPATCLQLLGPNGPVNLGPSGPTMTTSAQSQTKVGWTLGAGVERKIAAHFSIGLEYRHTDLGSFTYGSPESIVSQGAVITDPRGGHPSFQANVAGATTRVRLSSDSIGLRINFHF